MKLIVGLGNPGKEYENTRHNIGFMVIDNYVKKSKLSDPKNKFNGIYYETKINDEKVIFLKPQKYMNLSGEVVRSYIDFFKIDVSNILIIHDDLDLEISHYKLKSKGSSGGHNGLNNIEVHLATNVYKRLKIGISKNNMIETKDYVLGKFSKEEKEVLFTVIQKSEEIINDFSVLTFPNLMNKYNNN